MPDFFVAIYRPLDYDGPAVEDAQVRADIDAVNAEMVDAGIRVFVGGLFPHEATTSLDRSPNGDVTERDGLMLNAEGYIGGFWVLQVDSMEEALKWGRKAAAACRASVEVRQFH